MNFDNPLSTSYVTSCAYDQSSKNFFFVDNPYVIVDNFEWLGWCWSGASGGVITFIGSDPDTEVTNNYFHGWTLTGTSALDQFRMITCNGTGCGNSGYYLLIDHNVFDGSDASLGTTAQKATGFALGAGYEISDNVFWHISNGYIGGQAPMIHDNLLYYLMEPSDATHGNMFEQQGGQCGTYFYNNLGYVSNEGEGYNLYTQAACPLYAFNNISFLYRVTFSGSVPLSHGDGTNCFIPENTGGSGSIVWHVFNNTLDFPCNFNQKNISLTQYFQNNHIVGYSPAALSSVAGPTIVDNGNELYQTEAAANAQGYTTTNFYAPTTGGATIGAGANLTSLCTAIPESVAAAACLNGYVGVTYNQTNHAAVANTPVARGTTWDAGAYQFAPGSASGRPNPPTGVVAAAQ